MKTPKITVTRKWLVDDVWDLCVEFKLYSKGSTKDYNAMLEYVSNNEPTVENIYIVAKDIVEHTRTEQTISNVMFLIEKDVVRTFFEIDDKED